MLVFYKELNDCTETFGLHFGLDPFQSRSEPAEQAQVRLGALVFAKGKSNWSHCHKAERISKGGLVSTLKLVSN